MHIQDQNDRLNANIFWTTLAANAAILRNIRQS